MTQPHSPDGTHILRHTLATLAYRANRILADAPEGFADFEAGEGVMTPRKMLNHMTIILGFAHSQLTETEFERPTKVNDWKVEVSRLYETITALDQVVEAGLGAGGDTVLRMLQGPILDAMTHVGQLSMLRRLAGSPTPADHYIKATVTIGRTGADQAPAAG